MGIKSGILIAATHSGAGKTTITLAILEALVQRGLTVQAFKAGPDYLDPTFHEAATGRPSRNLDGWMMGKSAVLKSFSRASRDADFSVIEGAMGLFDGLRGRSDEGSSAQIARWLSMPVVLVIDAKGFARTAGPMISGLRQFDPELNIQGVIFNRVGSQNHFEILKESVESVCKVKVLGGIPNDPSLLMPHRHLGLVHAKEGLTGDIRSKLAKIAETSIDLDALLQMEYRFNDSSPIPDFKHRTAGKRCKIGIARDEAFHFYYRDNLDLLEEGGAELVSFSPLHDDQIPAVDGLYFGGGYPEVYAEALSRNRSMMESIREFSERQGPIYGECGGLMILSRSIETVDEKLFPMAGLLPGRVKMGRKLKALGYREVVSRTDNLLFQKGERAKGHEYHYSEWVEDADGGLPIRPSDLWIGRSKDRMDRSIPRPEQWPPAYHLFRGGETAELKEEGFAKGSILASYIHLHFASYPDLAARWISACEAFRGR